jgi:hypothetical protein
MHEQLASCSDHGFTFHNGILFSPMGCCRKLVDLIQGPYTLSLALGQWSARGREEEIWSD